MALLKYAALMAALCGLPLGAGAMETAELVRAALQADRNGQPEQALQWFTQAAEQGDAIAMTTVGLRHFQGQGTAKDACQAVDWFRRAARAGDADALANLGVMFRDGDCVEKNRRIAYLTFLMVHMNQMGSESTQVRNNANLRREVDELPRRDMEAALCYTGDYLAAMLFGQVKGSEVPDALLPHQPGRQMRDSRWWSAAEKAAMRFECPAPWRLSPAS